MIPQYSPQHLSMYLVLSIIIIIIIIIVFCIIQKFFNVGLCMNSEGFFFFPTRRCELLFIPISKETMNNRQYCRLQHPLLNKAENEHCGPIVNFVLAGRLMGRIANNNNGSTIRKKSPIVPSTIYIYTYIGTLSFPLVSLSLLLFVFDLRFSTNELDSYPFSHTHKSQHLFL